MGDGRQDDLAMPSGQVAAFEVLESDLVLQFQV